MNEPHGLFGAPPWLRNLGQTAWLLVGIAVLLVGLVWVLGITSTIVGPVLVGLVVATVASPIVSVLARHGWPRALGALLVLLALVALAVVILLLVLGGIVGEGDKISTELSSALDKLQSWIQSLGVSSSGAGKAHDNLASAVPELVHVFVVGVASGIRGIASLAFGFSFTALAVFFLLKDGPSLHRWLDRHLGVEREVAQTVTNGVVVAVRRYFLGVTIVAAFNAVVIWIAALILGVPLAATIAVVTFVTAYVPFVGAVVSGAFAVLIALGSSGTTTALIMLAVVILANGTLQNIVQPFAMGAALRMNPLLILVVTISAGALLGTLGMVLAAPLLSAAIQISGQLHARRGEVVPPGAASVAQPDSG